MNVIISESLLAGNDIDPRWYGGPFAQLKLMPPKGKGARFEAILKHLLLQCNIECSHRTNTSNDMVIDGVSTEVKGSTVTKDTDNCFSFLQIRPRQDYEQIVLMAFYFDGTIELYKISKHTINDLIGAGVFKPQHGGKDGESGTYSFNGSISKLSPYFWFKVKVSSDGKKTH